MTLLKTVETLRERGHSVSYIKRKDGSIRITSIDGARFAPNKSEGNALARSMTGQSLSARQTKQRESQRRQISARRARRKAPAKKTLSPEMKRLIRKAQRRIRKVSDNTGTITTKTVRARVEQYGEKATREHINRIVRHFEGYAYPENVEALAAQIKMTGKQLKSPSLASLSNEVKTIKETFLEKWIQPCYEVLYDAVLQGRANPGNGKAIGDNAAMQIKAIIGR